MQISRIQRDVDGKFIYVHAMKTLSKQDLGQDRGRSGQEADLPPAGYLCTDDKMLVQKRQSQVSERRKSRCCTVRFSVAHFVKPSFVQG